ncbi:phytase [Marinimicrobium agarilyticum]|uniref:phytase n=1 Tax=Marinimicrobium agarilyticum TaxID=306546 RepID=UPI00041C2AC0|nr:phytase [Marinimicrobium agarilyticum]
MRTLIALLLGAGLMVGLSSAATAQSLEPLPEPLTGSTLAPVVNGKQRLQGWWQLDDNLRFLNTDFNEQYRSDVEAEGVAMLREPDGQLLLASVLGAEQKPTLMRWNARTNTLETVSQVSSPDFVAETLCLQRDPEGNVYLFLIDERGSASQWWLRDSEGNPANHKVRDMAIAPNGTACAADARSNLFLAEEGLGLWQYPSNPEAAPGRSLVDVTPPFGTLAEGAEALALVGQTLVAIDIEHRRPRLYTPTDGGWNVWPLDDGGALATLAEPEQLYAWRDGEQLQLVLRDDDSGRHYRLSLALPEGFPRQYLSDAAPQKSVPTVKPVAQTEAVARFGDAADDPAIWVHPSNPSASRVLGTDKKLGLDVFDMEGRRVQHLSVGRVNNVDLRYGFEWGNGTDDIAVATQRDHNTLSVYRINAQSGEVSHQAELPTGLEEIYGICLYQSPKGATYAIANGKSGRFEQHRLFVRNGEIQSEVARHFAVDTQPEGCVADDKRGQLYIGEEDHGLWTLPAEPETGSELAAIIEVGDVVVADLEGVALYPENDARYLVLSSQGDHSYVILDAEAPYKVRGKFRVAADAKTGIDGASETDGLETTARPLGAAFPKGMLVVQDGHNVMPEAPQNFKYIPWTDIAEALNLDD